MNKILCMTMNLLWLILMYLESIPVTTKRSTADIITVPEISYCPEILNFISIKALPPCK